MKITKKTIALDNEAELLSKLKAEVASMDYTVLEPADSENPTHYVNNKLFYEALSDYIALCASVDEGKPYPRVPEYIGECFLKIAQKTAMRPNFWRYTYKEDMIGDAVENCLIYIRNFDPSQDKKNPFGYFSRYVWHAFLRRIEDEEKKRYIRAKEVQRMGVHVDTYSVQEHDLDEDYQNSMVVFLQENNDVIADYEAKLVRRKEKAEAVKKQKDIDAGIVPVVPLGTGKLRKKKSTQA